MVTYKKYFKKQAKRVGRFAKKRYFKGKGYSRPKLGQMAKDVRFLKDMINSEKKRINITANSSSKVGQVDGNNSGHFIIDITPVITQGVGYNERIGNSVKWTSSFLEFQLEQLPGAVASNMLTFYIIQIMNRPYNPVTNVTADFLVPNKFIELIDSPAVIYDNNSSRNQDYFKNFRVLRRVKYHIPADDFSGQPFQRNLKIPLKFRDHHLKWEKDTATLTAGQIVLLITATNGNESSSTASTLTVPTQTAVNTGMLFYYNFLHYFIDN